MKLFLNPSKFNLILSRTLHTRRNAGARVPFVQNYRNNWPNTENILPDHVEEPVLPPRTVPDSCLRFHLTSTFDRGSSIFYPHMHTHPADLKVVLQVSAKDLSLTPEELRVFIRMVGPRYNHAQKYVRIISRRFPNRMENKRYTVYLLERLLSEARRLTAEGLEYEEKK